MITYFDILMGNSKVFTRDQKIYIFTYLDKELLVLENKSISLPRRTSILSSNSILFMSLAARVASWALRYSTDSNWDRVFFRYVFNKSEEATTDTELIAMAADLKKNKTKYVKIQIKKSGKYFLTPSTVAIWIPMEKIHRQLYGEKNNTNIIWVNRS